MKVTMQKAETDAPLYLIVDLFCGAGGTTIGFAHATLPKKLWEDADLTELALKAATSSYQSGSMVTNVEERKKIAKVIACVNHDPVAIKSHWTNHPEVKHFEEDIRTLDLTGLIDIVNYWKKIYPEALLILWASLECTNFSKAKGGQPRDADSRTLADHLARYITALNPDYVQIENVVEFMSWGPLDKNGKPVSRKNGSDWMRWRKTICDIGYYDEWKELNSANFGAHTSRNRLFGCFAKNGLPVCWPEPTHAKNPAKNPMYSDLKKWNPVKEMLDFNDEGTSIFLDLVEKKEKAAFNYICKKETAAKKKHKVIVLFPAGIDQPLYGMEPKVIIDKSNYKKFDKIVTAFKEEHGEIKFYRYDPYSDATYERVFAGLLKFVANGDKSFISKYFSGGAANKNKSINDPAGTITTIDHHALVQGKFLLKYNSKDKKGKHNPPSIEEPCPTITVQNRLGLVQPNFLAAYYGNGDNVSPVTDPCPVIPTKDRFNLVQPQYFIDKHYGTAQNQSIDQPAGSIMPTDKHRLVGTVPFVMPTNFANKPTSIEDPLGTITANRKHHYIVNPSHGGCTASTEAPCPVIVARQDKAPLSLVQAINGQFSIAIFDSDSEIVKKIKMFMAAFGLVDIKMRMLRVQELKTIQGFPSDYILEGNQSDQKKFIGNSVVPQVVTSWIETMAMRTPPKIIKVYFTNQKAA